MSGNKYLVLFDINYFKIIKTDKNFTIKFFFNILKIQTQKLFNVDDYSLNKNIITIPLPPPPPPFIPINYKITNDKINNDKITNEKINNDKIRIIISEEELLSKRNELRSIKHEIKKIDKKSIEYDSIDNFTKDLLLQKNLLKEVKKKKLKKTKKSTKKSNIELERELEIELEKELEIELEKELEKELENRL